MSRVLVDTNVLIYIKDSSSAFHGSAQNVFNKGDELFLTSKNLTEYYAVVTKGEKPLLAPSEALLDITEFVSNCTLLYPNDASQQKLSALILKHKPKGLLIHDFEIAAIGLANGVSKIATFNKADFGPISEIEVVNSI